MKFAEKELQDLEFIGLNYYSRLNNRDWLTEEEVNKYISIIKSFAELVMTQEQLDELMLDIDRYAEFDVSTEEYGECRWWSYLIKSNLDTLRNELRRRSNKLRDLDEDRSGFCIEFSNQTREDRWCTRLQTPYPVVLSAEIVRNEVYHALEAYLMVMLGVENSDLNFATDVRLNQNIKRGYWDVNLYHNHSLGEVDPDLTGRKKEWFYEKSENASRHRYRKQCCEKKIW